MDKYAVVLRYVISYIAAAIASKYAWDAAQTQSFQDALFAVIGGIVTIAPMIYALIKRPSEAAMQAAKETDKIITGDKLSALISTPDSAPNVIVKKA